MTGYEQQQDAVRSTPAFRLDVQLHELLRKPTASPTLHPAVQPTVQPQPLPEPVFPQHPELLEDEDVQADLPHVVFTDDVLPDGTWVGSRPGWDGY